MTYYRQMRKGDELHQMTADGPVVMKVKCGRACVEVDAPKAVKINHRKRESRLRPNPKRD